MTDQNTPAPADLVEAICHAQAKADGLDWDEVCGCDTEAGDCDSSTCMAAWDEDHDAALSRRHYRKRAQAAIAAYQDHMASDGVVQADRDALERVRANCNDMNGPEVLDILAAHRRAAAVGKDDEVAPSYFIKPSAVVGNMRFLARHFERLLAMPSGKQPHYPKGMRPFSNGDLRNLADACATAANDLDAAMRATPQPDPRDAEIARLRTDAARYHWLRDHSCPPHNFYVSVPDEFHGVRYTPAEVDEYIDQALSALAKEGK